MIRELLATTPDYVHGSVGSVWFIALREVAERVREAIEGWGSLYAWAATRPEAETMAGRDTLYLIPQPGGGRWVVRRLTHGGLLAPLTGDRFVRLGLPRPFNELRVSQRLREAGIPTPAVEAAAVHPSGPFYGGEVARREIADADDLAAILFDAERSDRDRRLAAMEAAGGLVGALHRLGLIHPDLNLRNILVRRVGREPKAYILDLERCRFGRVNHRRRRRMLRRLQRSARRFRERTGGSVSETEWEAFWLAYSKAERQL